MGMPQTPPPRREPTRERRELIPPVEFGLTINGLPLKAKLKLSAKELAQLQDIDDPEKAAGFIESRLEGAELVAEATKTEICREIIDQVYAGRAPSRLDPPQGTRPSVSPDDLRKYFGRKGFELVGMREGGAEDEWDEPYSFGFNRYGYNSDDAYERIEYRLRKSGAGSVEIDFEEHPELFSDELLNGIEARRQEMKASAEDAYQTQIRQDVERLDAKDIADWRDKVIDEMVRTFRQPADDAAVVKRFFDDLPLDAIRNQLRGASFRSLYNPESKGADYGREKAHAAVKDEAIRRAGHELYRFYRKELSANPETAIFRTRIAEKLQVLGREFIMVDEASDVGEKVRILKRLKAELSDGGSRYDKPLTAKEALQKDSVASLFSYASRLDEKLMRSENERRKLESAVENMLERLNARISDVVRPNVLKAVSDKFGVSFGRYYSESRAFKDAAKKAESPADKRFLNKKKNEYYSALPIPYAAAVQANELYKAYMRKKDVKLLIEMGESLSPHDACGELHICFPLTRPESLTPAQVDRLLAAARRIEQALAIPDLESHIADRGAGSLSYEPPVGIETVKGRLREFFQAVQGQKKEGGTEV